MRIKTEEIKFYEFSDHLGNIITVCPDCIEKGDKITASSIVTEENAPDEEWLIFCDRCDKDIV